MAEAVDEAAKMVEEEEKLEEEEEKLEEVEEEKEEEEEEEEDDEKVPRDGLPYTACWSYSISRSSVVGICSMTKYLTMLSWSVAEQNTVAKLLVSPGRGRYFRVGRPIEKEPC